MRKSLLQEPGREVWLVRAGELATLGVLEGVQVEFTCARVLLLAVQKGVEVQLSQGSDYALLRKRADGLSLDYSVGRSGRRTRYIDERAFLEVLAAEPES